MFVFDVFKGQEIQRVKDLIETNHCVSIYVPPYLTNEFQPFDLTINGIAKEFINKRFSDLYANQITKKLEEGEDVYKINVTNPLTIIKPVHAR